jgi:hypothetical protein
MRNPPVIRARPVAPLLALALVFASCGGGPSLPEYAADVEALVHTMNAELDAADLLTAGDPAGLSPYIERTRRRAAARREFVTGLARLDPPDPAAELHGFALDLVTRLADLEEEIADATASSGSVDELSTLWEGELGDAFGSIDAEAVELCRAAQAYLDATETAGAFEGLPFIPTEMQEVVVVAFRCTAEERR